MEETLDQHTETLPDSTLENHRTIKFKKLELQGFKSFPDRTELLFDKDICAIVGPNGCGKSNILDALKWVLGEQGPGQLRARAMADIIFNGAVGRKPVGMAEITLTIEAPAGSLPLAYQEIEVSRRLYRNGESEYLINRTPCRLKDIVDLFLDTGMGKGAYSLIEQGRVDALVTAKPTDRRSFLEQTAGIEKYKVRKKEAMSKLNSTEQNLARIQDVAAEVKSRKRSLSRQARKAIKYKTLQKELRELHEIYLTGRFAKYQRVIAEQTKELEHLENVLARNTAESGLQSAALEQMHNQVSETQSRLGTAAELAEKSELRLNYLENRLTDLKNRDAELLQEEKETLKEAEGLEARKEDRSKALEEIDSQRNDRMQLLDSLQEEAAVLDSRYQQINGTGRQIRESLEELRRKRLTQVEEQSRLQNQLTAVQEGLRRQDQRREQIRKDRDEISLEHAKVLKQKDNVQVRLERLEDRCRELDDLVRELTDEINELSAIRRRLLTEQTELQNKKTRTDSRLQSLKELVASGEGLDSGVRTVISEFRDKMNDLGKPFVSGTIAALYRTETKYETALASALHNHLDEVVVASEGAMISIRKHLKDGQYSRVVLRSLNDIKPDTSDQKDLITDLTPMIELVKTKNDFQSLFRKLLQGSYLVSSLSDPETLSRQYPELCLVDQEGNCYGPGTRRVITGKEDNRLAFRKRISEIDALTETAELLKNQLEAGYEKTVSISEQLDELTSQQGSRKADLLEVTQDRAVARRDQTHAENVFAGIEKRRKQLVDDEKRVDGELKSLSDKFDELAGKIQAGRDDKELSDDIQKWEKELELSISDGDDMREQLTEVRIRLRTTGEQVESATRESNRYREEIRNLTELSSRHREQAAKKAATRIENEVTSREMKSELAKLIQVHPGQKNLVINLRTRLEQLNKAEKDLSNELNELRQKERQLERDMAEVRIKIAGFESSRASLVEETDLDLEMLAKNLTAIPDDEELQDWKDRMDVLNQNIQLLGDVNLAAEAEHRELVERNRFLDEQIKDIEDSVSSLRTTIQQINRASKIRFMDAFEVVNRHFGEVFQKLFNGGEAALELIDPDDPLESGVDIVCKPPGKRARTIDLLSGGEKALAALSLLLAGFRYRPSPLLFLDEVDAPLDDANVVRFTEFLKDLATITQVVMITHNATTMEAADILYGVTMENPGISKLVSARLSML